MMISTVAALATTLSLAPSVQLPVRYDLREGDHLIYREVLDETTDNRRPYGLENSEDRPLAQQWERGIHAEWEVHLVVLGADEDRIVVGAQRNRVDLGLSRYSIAREDALADHGPGLLARLGAQRSARYAHGMRITPTGGQQLPGQILREWDSKALWTLTEFPPLPQELSVGGSLWQNALLDMQYVAREWEKVDNDTCIRIRGLATAGLFLDRAASLPDSVVHRIWYCPNLGIVKRIEFEGSYPGPLSQEVHQTLSWELVERRRGESLVSWMSDEDAREGAVAGMALMDQLPFSLGQIYGMLGTGSEEMDLRLLGLAYRSGWQAPPPAMLAQALESRHPRVRALAARLAEPAPPEAPPPESPVCAAPAPRDTGWELTGTAVRALAASEFNGWPYGVRVPEDYRGDEPFPLVFYLSGNSGPMLEGISIASAEMSKTGYLVVYPQAVGSWSDSRSTAMFDELYRAVMKRFNVDPDRVYITGRGNAGTGKAGASVERFAKAWPHRFAAAVSDLGDDGLGRALQFFERSAARTTPRTLRVSTSGADHPREYWVEVFAVPAEAGQDQVPIATVDAELGDDGVITLETQNVRRIRLLLSPRLLGSIAAINVRINGRSVYDGPVVHDCALFKRTWDETGDLYSAYSQALEFDIGG